MWLEPTALRWCLASPLGLEAACDVLCSSWRLGELHFKEVLKRLLCLAPATPLGTLCFLRVWLAGVRAPRAVAWHVTLRFLEKSTKTLSNFQARKICHAGREGKKIQQTEALASCSFSLIHANSHPGGRGVAISVPDWYATLSMPSRWCPYRLPGRHTKGTATGIWIEEMTVLQVIHSSSSSA